MFNYSLDTKNYTWTNAFFWGNFLGHCKKAQEGNLGNRLVHALIATAEFFPLIGQVASICEMLIVKNFSDPSNQLPSPPLSSRRISKTPPTHTQPKAATNNKHVQGDQAPDSSQRDSKQQEIDAATKIQSAYRRHSAKLALKEHKRKKSEEQKSTSATEIQSICRGYLARKRAERAKAHVLDYSLVKKAQGLIDNTSCDFPRASNGRSLVLLPPGVPLVLKKIDHQADSTERMERYNNMEKARDICIRNNYEHIVVPKAKVYKNFTIEKRLPIDEIKTKEQIGLYIENRNLFTPAVQEFTEFLCQASIFDIQGGSSNPFEEIHELPLPRYDNIPLYIENGQAKIGLIDLERFENYISDFDGDWCFHQCVTAITFFPYHLDEIISAAEKFDPNIRLYRAHLEKYRDKALKFCKTVYENHSNLIQQKGITTQDPFIFKKVDPSRIEDLKKSIETELRNRDGNTGWLGADPDKTISSFNEKAFPHFLEVTYKMIDDMLRYNMQEFTKKNRAISSHIDLLSLRTLGITQYYIDSNIYNLVADHLSMFQFESVFEPTEFIYLVIDTIFKELERGGEIAYYNPRFGGYTRLVFC